MGKKYQNYQNARDTAWDVILKNDIRSLPVDIKVLCRTEGIITIGYGKAEAVFASVNLDLEELKYNNDGFSLAVGSKKLLFYDETMPQDRQRFTIAHELGHYMLGHVTNGEPTPKNNEPSENDGLIEVDANIFASRILSPAIVLRDIGVKSAEEITRLCGISPAAARFRMKRLQALYDREKRFIARTGKSCFGISPLEREIEVRFLDFIRRCRETSDR